MRVRVSVGVRGSAWVGVSVGVRVGIRQAQEQGPWVGRARACACAHVQHVSLGAAPLSVPCVSLV